GHQALGRVGRTSHSMDVAAVDRDRAPARQMNRRFLLETAPPGIVPTPERGRFAHAVENVHGANRARVVMDGAVLAGLPGQDQHLEAIVAVEESSRVVVGAELDVALELGSRGVEAAHDLVNRIALEPRGGDEALAQRLDRDGVGTSSHGTPAWKESEKA